MTVVEYQIFSAFFSCLVRRFLHVTIRDVTRAFAKRTVEVEMPHHPFHINSVLLVLKSTSNR